MRARIPFVVAVVATLAAGIGTSAPASALPSSARAVAPYPAPTSSTAATPVVAGKQFYDTSRSGNPLWIPRGVNWPSFEYACYDGYGYSDAGATDAAAAAMVSWGINFVRIPLNEGCWLGDQTLAGGLTASGYQQSLRNWVTILNTHGMVVDLDLHWSAPAGHSSSGQAPLPDARSTQFWTEVATDFRDWSSVMFEPFNEPVPIDLNNSDPTASYTDQTAENCWLNGNCTASYSDSAGGVVSYAAVGVNQLLDAIRGAGAYQPVLVDGIDWANDVDLDLSGDVASDYQIALAFHTYQDQANNSPSDWTAHVAPITNEFRPHPVVITEFGESDGGSDFLNQVMRWGEANRIGYAAWAWWATNSGDSSDNQNYALITDTTSFAAKSPSGTAFATFLQNFTGGFWPLYITRYDGTIYELVNNNDPVALSYARWKDAYGSAAPMPAPTQYLHYPWSSTIYGQTSWANQVGMPLFATLNYGQWVAVGRPAPTTSGWIGNSFISKYDTGSELFLSEPTQVGSVSVSQHKLTWSEWSATGFHAYFNIPGGWEKLNWAPEIFEVSSVGAASGRLIFYQEWQDAGLPTPLTITHIPGEQFQSSNCSSAIRYLAGSLLNRTISYAEWVAAGRPIPSRSGTCFH